MYDRTAHALLLVVTMGLVPRVSSAHQIDTVPLRPPDAELRGHEGFTAVRSIRELADGRVLLTEPMLDRMSVVDFARSSVTPIGRPGRGRENTTHRGFSSR